MSSGPVILRNCRAHGRPICRVPLTGVMAGGDWRGGLLSSNAAAQLVRSCPRLTEIEGAAKGGLKKADGPENADIFVC